jgi:NitT/TauT family transport system permease protein
MCYRFFCYLRLSLSYFGRQIGHFVPEIPFANGVFFARAEREASSLSTSKGSQRLALVTSPQGWWRRGAGRLELASSFPAMESRSAASGLAAKLVKDIHEYNSSDEAERKMTVRALSAVFPRSSPGQRVRISYETSMRLLTILPPLLLGMIILASWYASTASGWVPAYKLPSPSDVGVSLWNGITSGVFLNNAWITLQESLGGFLLAVIVALPIGYGLAKWPLFSAMAQPYLAAGQAVPAIVIAPFLIFWIGYGMGSLLVLCALVVLFPMTITTALGFQTLDRSLIEAAHVEGASFWPMLVQIEFPLALPAIMAAIRTGLTLSITGALVGEFVNGSDQGLGALVQIAKDQYNQPLMFATVVILAVLAASLYGLAKGLTKLSEAIYS